jgi:hypothetical protein
VETVLAGLAGTNAAAKDAELTEWHSALQRKSGFADSIPLIAVCDRPAIRTFEMAERARQMKSATASTQRKYFETVTPWILADNNASEADRAGIAMIASPRKGRPRVESTARVTA